jgi:hypothetical protein
MKGPRGGTAPFRIARVVITPRDRALLSLDASAAAAQMKAAFGPCCVDVTGVSTGDTSWRASVVIDARKDKDARLLYQHAVDDRLWRTFIESLYSNGTCDVQDLESADSAPVSARHPPR